jgi:ATP-dependent RNA helicase DHX37/DHR1
VELPDTAQLFKERRSATQMLELERESDSESESDSDDGDEAQQDSEDQGRAAMLGQTASNPGNLVHKVHKPGSVGEKRKVDGKYAVDDAGAAKRQRAPFSGGSYVDDGSGVLMWELEGQIGSETKAAQMRELKRAAAEAKQEILANGDASLEEDENDELGGGIAATVKPRLASGKTGKSRVVLVQRPESIEAVRSELPIVAMEQEIMEAVAENDVLVLCGATGCGKTTQVPQFLYEAGYGSALFDERCGAIGITQPRRVAAVSTATRVAEELGTKLGDVVGYQAGVTPCSLALRIQDALCPIS